MRRTRARQPAARGTRPRPAAWAVAVAVAVQPSPKRQTKANRLNKGLNMNCDGFKADSKNPPGSRRGHCRFARISILGGLLLLGSPQLQAQPGQGGGGGFPFFGGGGGGQRSRTATSRQ